MRSWTHPTSMNCKDVLQCIFNLNKHDMAVFTTLRTHGEQSVQELAHRLDKDRSTIYRSLQKLTKCGICEKQTHTIQSGGYYHTYKCQDIENMQNQMYSCLESWFSHMQQTISHLDKELT